MRKFKGLLCSVSMAAALLFSGMAAYADEAGTASEEAVTEAAEDETTQGISEVEEVTEAAARAEAVVGGLTASDRSTLENYAEQSIQMIVAMTEEEIEAQLNPTSILVVTQESVITSLESWVSVKEELGALKAFKSHEISVTDDDIIIKTTCEFENTEGEVTTTLNRDDLTMEGMAFAVGGETLGSKMTEAAMNTVMGIGIVFLTLLFLSFLISQFKHISAWENKLSQKNAAPAPTAPVPAPVAAPVVEEETDDGELIAVIAAAIAAAEGTSTDGFTVRSIKKHNRNKWQRA